MNSFLQGKRFRLMFLFLFACLFGATIGWAQAPSPVIATDNGPNAEAQQLQHYVILVSLDGFRYDYAKRFKATNLLEMAAEGASAPEGLIPSYPSVTFPNHYTIVTGLYPEHHGIVENSFYDPARNQTYGLNDPVSLTDGSWYGGTPLWVLAEQQGMRSACFFWPGSEADIQGVRPSYYVKYDRDFPNQKRVEQVLSWLRLPAEKRPHFITLYMSDTDHAGHQYGPDSPQVAAAVNELDTEIGRLEAGLKELKLPVDLIVLSDHGMVKVKDWITLDQYGVKSSDFAHTAGAALYAKSDADAEKAYQALKGKSDKFLVYRRSQMPANLHDDSNPRTGDPMLVLTGPYVFRFSVDPRSGDRKPEVGEHGYDPARVPEMKGIFFAEGPDIRRGITVAPFENVNVYPFVAKILGLDISHLKTGPIDGNISALQGVLQTQTQKP